MFNGKDLEGWSALPGGTWTVEDGALVGRKPDEKDIRILEITDKLSFTEIFNGKDLSETQLKDRAAKDYISFQDEAKEFGIATCGSKI